MLKTTKDIILENKDCHIPNAGIIALAKAADDEPDEFCIIDNFNRKNCIDRGACHRPYFMLACVSTLNSDGNEMSKKALEIYNHAFK